MRPQAISELIERARCGEKADLLLPACQGRRVLDVGCAGQAHTVTSDDWLHSKLRKVATEVVGVDINESAVRRLRDSGYDVRLPSELGEEETFDVVVMGDVIEHVNDPVAFLATYGRVLARDGEILVTTPNAFSATLALGVLATGRVSVNAEHTVWFDPQTLSETARRAGLVTTGLDWVVPSLKCRSWKERIVLTGGRIMSALRPYTHDAFLLRLAHR